MVVVNKVEYRRLKLGLTQKQLAEKAKVSAKTIYRIEAEEPVTLRTMAKIWKTLSMLEKKIPRCPYCGEPIDV